MSYLEIYNESMNDLLVQKDLNDDKSMNTFTARAQTSDEALQIVEDVNGTVVAVAVVLTCYRCYTSERTL